MANIYNENSIITLNYREAARQTPNEQILIFW